MNMIDHIAAVPLFEGLSHEQHTALAGIAISRSYHKGQLIFAEGDEGIGFYVVTSGRVKIFKLSSEGKEQIFHIFGPGEPFGEVAVFTGRPFPAFAEAFSQNDVLFFPRDAFIGLIRNDPTLSLNMLAVLSVRLRKFTSLVEDLSLKEVPSRVAAYLLHLSGKEHDAGHIELDITKGQLASLLGTIPETLSRILSKMNKQQLINIEGSHITIVDPTGLEEIAREGKKLSHMPMK
jgi:CRP-like cAMP-binding protein